MKTCNILFLCTGNSARSVLGEALVNHLMPTGGHVHGYSAGSHPQGEIHPLTLKLLTEHGIPTVDLRSKSWDEFATPDAPQMDFIFTVCDRARDTVSGTVGAEVGARGPDQRVQVAAAALSPAPTLRDTVPGPPAGEACPYWPGHPVMVHWGLPDPAAVEGDEATRMYAFRDTLTALRRRLDLLLALPLQELDTQALTSRLREIGKA